MKNRKGFTLIEVMIVLVIVSMLYFFATSDISGSKRRAEKAKVLSDIASLKNAMAIYSLKNLGVFPDSLNELKKKNIIKKMPRDPWNNEYVLRKVTFYTCRNHPEVRSDVPGFCTICPADTVELVPREEIYIGSYSNGTIEIMVGVK